MSDKEIREIREYFENMSLEQLLAVIPVLKVLGQAKKAGMLFDGNGNLQ
jgi:hypothetical protein